MYKLDLALIYLRVVVGGMLILHNISIQQNYNEVISSYHQFEGLPATLYLVLFSAVESLAAVMLIIGWKCRLAAAALIVGTILALIIYFPNTPSTELEIKGIFTFIYIFLFIAGAGLYSLDGINTRRAEAIKEKKNDD